MSGPLEIVNRANQRGGRMLSVIDLVEAGTLSPKRAVEEVRAAWLRFRGGAPYATR